MHLQLGKILDQHHEAQRANLIGINHGAFQIKKLRLGAPNMTNTSVSGSFYIEAFEPQQIHSIGP